MKQNWRRSAPEHRRKVAAMNAFEMSEKKIKIISTINYLREETRNNNTETVLLTNDEVLNIVESLSECLEIVNEKLKMTPIA